MMTRRFLLANTRALQALHNHVLLNTAWE